MAVQNEATGEADLLAECEAADIAYVPYFPLGGGVRPLDAERLGEVAAGLGATMAQVAIAALLATSPCTLAIPGTGSLPHLEENVAAATLPLPRKPSPPSTSNHASTPPRPEPRQGRSQDRYDVGPPATPR